MSGRSGILLFSGGLDSLLAAKLLIEEKINVTGLHFLLPFTPPDINTDELPATRYANALGFPLSYYRCDREYIDIIRNPLHGYGKQMNPCIDCKIYFLKKARKMMITQSASFIATGDVVGQRPMSQMKHMLNHIEKASGLRDYLLRPLSAKLLRPTKAELDGIINREKLLDINGRSRKRQIELAKEYNISDYKSPAGGCLLTDPNISKRLKDLFDNHPDFTMTDFYLLTLGRHFRLNKDIKIIVSRNHHENAELEKYRDSADCFIIPEFKGPLIYVKGKLKADTINLIGSIALRYRNATDSRNCVSIHTKKEEPITIAVSNSASDNLLKKVII